MAHRPEDADFEIYRETGDPEALARVFDAVAPRLLLVAGHVTRDAAMAEDLVQTTFLQAIRDAGRYDGRAPVGAWLGGILRHRALDLRRRTDLRETDALPADLSGAVDPADLVSDQELFDRAVAAVEQLPEPYRQVLLLRLVHGLTPAAIAHTLGRAPGTVRMQLKRGAERLREALPDRSGLLPALLCVPVRGLSTVRETVLSEAKLALAASAVTTSVAVPTSMSLLRALGGLAMSKTLLAALLGLVALLTWMFTSGPLGQANLPGEAVARASGADGVEAPTPASSIEAGAGAPSGRTEAGTAPEASTPAIPTGLVVIVRFGGDGSPAADVGVYVRPLDGGLGREVRTGADGTARFEGLASDVLDVHLDRSSARQRVDLRRGSTAETRTVEFVLTETFTLRGRVVDLDGEGVASATVYRMNASHHDVLHRVAACDADGSFEIRGLAEEVELIARAPGHQPSEVEDADVGDDDLELELGGRGCSLRGQVLDPQGAGVPHAWIAVGVDEDAREEWEGSRREPDQGAGHKNLDREGILLRADEHGRFESDEIPAGHLVVLARRFDGQGAEVGWTTLWLTAEGATDVTLFLQAGAEVYGVLRDGAGHPVPGLELEAEWEGTPRLGQMEDDVGHYVSDRRVVSGADGSFSLDGLLPGEYDLRVYGEQDELLQEGAELTEGQRHHWQPVIAARGALTVELKDAGGRPIEGWYVGASAREGAFPGWRALTTATDAGGRVRLPDLEEGVPLQLSVFAGLVHRIPVALRLVTVEGEDTYSLELDPDERPSASLSGRLVDGTGAQATQAFVVIARPGWDTTAYVAVEEGAFHLEGLSPGEVLLRTTDGAHLGTWALGSDEALDVGALTMTDDE